MSMVGEGGGAAAAVVEYAIMALLNWRYLGTHETNQLAPQSTATSCRPGSIFC